MATKKAKKISDKSTLDILKTKVRTLNKVTLETSNEIVDETLATGEQWQNLFAKSLKKGTILFGKQQDLMFKGLEMLKDQVGYGNMRMKKLLDFEAAEKSVSKKVAKKAKPVGKKIKKNIDELMDATIKADKAVKKIVKPGPAKKAEAPKPKAVKTPAIPAKPKPVSAETVKPANLTIIEGIGPKIQELLNKAGIVSFDQLAETSPADLKKILATAGKRFQMHDPSTWTAQAKLAAAGKMEELKVLQVELKGGK